MKVTNNFDPRQVADLYLKRLEKIERNELGGDKTVRKNRPEADSVEISSRARELQLYRARLKELPGVRAELVKSVKKELVAGSYRIDAEAIARGIIEEHRLDKLV